MNKVELDGMSLEQKRKLLELVEERTRREARDSLAVFAGRNGYVPAAHHKLLIEALERVERGDIRNLLVQMPPGSAKALALDTPIPTPDGWKTMGELKAGDRVFGDDGRPCNVVWVSPVHRDRPVYSVRTDCGDEIVADHDHEWVVRLCGKRPVFKVKETHELARKRSKRPMIQRAAALELPHVDLPIHPYLLGVWLGNGTSSGLTITAAVEDQAHYRSRFEALGYVTSDRSADLNFGVLGVRSEFVKLGLINDPAHNAHGRKHIPPAYLRASREQRLALVQGLVDTDGTVSKKQGMVTFCSTSLELASGLRELVRSLGVKAGWSESRAMLYGKDCGPSYRVFFYLKAAVSLPRKAQYARDQKRTPNTYIDVTPLPNAVDTVCIEVDSPSHLFLAGESMTPTHNSTYSSILFPAWFLGRNPRLNVVSASHTGELAERFGRKVRSIVGSPDFESVFKVKLSDVSAAAGRWETDRGGEFFAVGVGGSITGRRADCVIIDDPVRSQEDADSETVREKTWDWYKSDLLTRLKPGGRQVLVMTRWHELDLAGMILEREADRWEVIKLEMVNTREDDPLGRKVGELLWPEWFTEEMLERAQLDARSWNALYQQTPRPDGGGLFKKSWMEYYQNPPNLRNVAPIMLVDPANTKSRKSDFTCIWVLGVGGDDNYYVLDIVRDKLELAERVDTVFRLHRKWKPRVVRYEQYAMQADIGALKMEMDRRSYRFRIQKVGGVNVSKVDRIRRLLPIFRERRMIFPESFPYTYESGKTVDLIQVFIEEELAAFPVGRHDDMLDALSRIAEPGLVIPRHVPPEEMELESSPQKGFEPFDAEMGY